MLLAHTGLILDWSSSLLNEIALKMV